MPKETFSNLDENKKNIIIDAAIKEFTENELHKARVSNIIKEAGIPRGSFYQYFEDIDDLYYFVIDLTFDEIFTEGYKHSEMTNDLFEYIRLTFDVDYNAYANQKRHRFMKNVFKSIGSNMEFIEHHHNRRKDYIITILNRMDLSDIRIGNEIDELVRLYEFLQHIKRSVIQGALMKNLTFEAARKELDWHLDILKHGLLKEE
ncbi:putative HTH-type transcriptional regulator YvdT [Candidatus Izimaplasma bacterium HR1]|jgi:AcrR family transcriptional regulator|uniref:TetR/AcrR family transcriptional regulator n=1 Tax=Candidatus Izimoplasma sp. HR1 TaxID=1541959 RepID=UPI0004F64E43|nr:putative HTH-type transcriptional regulator YvdT [Candidatus Izimaplasma bacterium HR1]